MQPRAFHAAIIYDRDREALTDYAQLLMVATGMDLVIDPWEDGDDLTGGAVHLTTELRAGYARRQDLLVLSLDEACARYGFSNAGEFL